MRAIQYIAYHVKQLFLIFGISDTNSSHNYHNSLNSQRVHNNNKCQREGGKARQTSAEISRSDRFE